MNDEENFTIEATFKKQQGTNLKKKQQKEEEARAYEKRIIDERTEFNRALEATRSKPEKSAFVPTVIRTREQRAIDRIEHLLEKDKKLNDSIINDEKYIEMKGDVVTETALRVDKLIRKALRKHERPTDDSHRGNRARLARKQTSVNSRLFAKKGLLAQAHSPGQTLASDASSTK